jgi:hypothetical protein
MQIVSVQIIADLSVGDLVLWHDDPLSSSNTPSLGWVIQKGRETISILMFSENSGLVEKKSVRHRDDPFWRESEIAGNWIQWGCFTVHPTTEILKELKPFLTKLKMAEARTPSEEPVRRGPGRPRKEEAVEVEVSE